MRNRCYWQRYCVHKAYLQVFSINGCCFLTDRKKADAFMHAMQFARNLFINGFAAGARENKAGVHAQFSLDEEKLAFHTREQSGEKDNPVILVHPYPKTIAALTNLENAFKLYQYHFSEYF